MRTWQRRPTRPAAVQPGAWPVVWQSCARKVRFPSLGAAEAVGARYGQVAYRCTFGEAGAGHHWHLTTRRNHD